MNLKSLQSNASPLQSISTQEGYLDPEKSSRTAVESASINILASQVAMEAIELLDFSHQVMVLEAFGDGANYEAKFLEF